MKARITDTWIVCARDPSQRRKVNCEYKLEMIEVESILEGSALLEKFHREEQKNIYFEEKVSLVEE